MSRDSNLHEEQYDKDVLKNLKLVCNSEIAGVWTDPITGKSLVNEAYITSKVNEEVKKAQEDRIKKSKSYCGCSMCLHHSEPYEDRIRTLKENQ